MLQLEKGKGAVEVDVSASFEALEYYLSAYHFNPYPIVVASLKEVSKQHCVIPYRCEAQRFLSEAQQSVSLPWVIYKDFKSSDS